VGPINQNRGRLPVGDFAVSKKFRAKAARDNHAALGPTPLPLGSRNYGNKPALSPIEPTSGPSSPQS